MIEVARRAAHRLRAAHGYDATLSTADIIVDHLSLDVSYEDEDQADCRATCEDADASNSEDLPRTADDIIYGALWLDL